MKFEIGDRVITKNNKFWSGKVGIVESKVEYEFYTIYMVRLDESDFKMGFRDKELSKI